MKKSIRAQFAIEFVVLIAFMFIVFLAFTAIITTKIIESKENERQQIAEDIASLAKNEIELAKSSSDGYIRTFNMPLRVQGNSYSISIVDNREIVVTYIDKEHILFLPQGISGNLTAGPNSLRKVNGIVYVNS